MIETTNHFPTIAFVGFGEAGHAFAASWSPDAPLAARAYDRGLSDPDARALIQSRCAEADVAPSDTPEAALAEAELIFSLVTADQALDAALVCAAAVRPGAIWLDGNSCAPQTKMKAASLIGAAGGRYVDMAIMAPVYPKRHQAPLLLAGSDADDAAVLLRRLGMRPEVAGNRIGDASSIKMLRSVLIKGLEALTSECLLAARRAGVEDAVIASLQASDPGIDWRTRASYNLERMLVHGGRRAAEMKEVCATLTDLNVPDWMSRGAVEWQQNMAALGLDAGDDAFAARADKVLNAL